MATDIFLFEMFGESRNVVRVARVKTARFGVPVKGAAKALRCLRCVVKYVPLIFRCKRNTKLRQKERWGWHDKGGRSSANAGEKQGSADQSIQPGYGPFRQLVFKLGTRP